jgi:hypothetical protein
MVVSQYDNFAQVACLEDDELIEVERGEEDMHMKHNPARTSQGSMEQVQALAAIFPSMNQLKTTSITDTDLTEELVPSLVIIKDALVEAQHKFGLKLADKKYKIILCHNAHSLKCGQRQLF